MEYNQAFRSGFDFANPISDEKLLRRPPPAKDITQTVVEITSDCYINGVVVKAGEVVTIDRDDALNIVGVSRGKIIK